MDMKKRLEKETNDASQKNDDLRKQIENNQLEKIDHFSKLCELLKDLEKEASSIEGVKFFISRIGARIRLGVELTMEISSSPWIEEFIVDETMQWGFPSYHRSEKRCKFKNENDAIDYILKKVAEYVAKLK